jgi:holo-[acyl-carrier protein] synthase
VIGVGTDLVDLDRFRRVLERTPGVARRLFRDAERAYAEGLADPVPSLGARFAAKEAVMKALGAGVGAVVMSDIEVVRADTGAPSVALHGTASTRAAELGVTRWHLSLTHTSSMAHAIAVAL